MSLPTGKLPPDLLAELLSGAVADSPEVRLGPAVGEDACAIALGGGILVAATDPVTLTGSGVGAHAVWINANDVAVMGVRPRWFLATVLLPPGTGADAVRALLAETRRALEQVGAVLVGGHTEVSAVVSQPLVVGQMLGFASDGRFVRTGGVRPGDRIVQIGPAPVEAAVVLAEVVADRLPAPLLRAARAALEDPGISVVDAALAAADMGATALHDPTEGGLSAGLHELAMASGVALSIDAEAVLWFEPGRAACEAAGADPWGALASGALLAAFAEAEVAQARRRLAAAGCAVSVLGAAEEGEGVRFGDGTPLPVFPRDEVARVLGD